MSLNSGFSYLQLAVFYGLFALLLLSASGRAFLKNKPKFEWFLDITNLCIQGLLVPFVQVTLLFGLLQWAVPQYQGALDLSAFWGFCLNFFVVDYLYYWNHRILHFKRFFPVHIVHHTVTYMDVLATSKNTLWTTLFIVYWWANGLLLYLTDLNWGVLLGMSLSASLDIWKHSTFLSSRPGVYAWMSKYLLIMTPLDHAWHHAQKLNANFGANLNLYDKLHGTYEATDAYPTKLGVNARLTPLQKLFFPFSS